MHKLYVMDEAGELHKAALVASECRECGTKAIGVMPQEVAEILPPDCPVCREQFIAGTWTHTRLL